MYCFHNNYISQGHNKWYHHILNAPQQCYNYNFEKYNYNYNTDRYKYHLVYTSSYYHIYHNFHNLHLVQYTMYLYHCSSMV